MNHLLSSKATIIPLNCWMIRTIVCSSIGIASIAMSVQRSTCARVACAVWFEPTSRKLSYIRYRNDSVPGHMSFWTETKPYQVMKVAKRKSCSNRTWMSQPAGGQPFLSTVRVNNHGSNGTSAQITTPRCRTCCTSRRLSSSIRICIGTCRRTIQKTPKHIWYASCWQWSMVCSCFTTIHRLVIRSTSSSSD